MKEQFSHILDQSVCLTRRQVAACLEGRMEPEELHAAQMHLASCPLCSLAMDGFEAHTEEGLAALSTLNTDFLKDHFDKSLPQIHLNSVVPAAVIRETRRKQLAGEHNVVPFRRLAVAAALLLVAGSGWWLMKNQGRDAESNREIAMATPVVNTEADIRQQEAPSPDGASSSVAADRAVPVQSAPATGSSGSVVLAAPVSTAPVTPAVADDLDRESRGDLAAGTSQSSNDATTDGRMTYSRSAAPESVPGGNSYQPNQTYNWSTTEEAADEKRKEKADNVLAAPAPKPVAQRSRAEAKPAPVAPIVASRADRSSETSSTAAPSAPNLESVRKAVAAGKKDEAKKMLQRIIQQGGNEKREAKKMLRRMNRENN